MRIKVPWILRFIGIHKPNYRLTVFKPDFSKPEIRFWATIILLVSAAILFSGIVYIVVNLPPALIRIGSAPGYFIRGLDQETSSEALIVSTFMLLGVLGVLFVRRSVEKMTEEDQLTFILGLVLFFLSFIVLTYFLYNYKLGLIS